jgi:hypothetical protein
LHIIVHLCFSRAFYWLLFAQNCEFRSTLDNDPTKIVDSQQKTCFLQNATRFLSVQYPKLSFQSQIGHWCRTTNVPRSVLILFRIPISTFKSKQKRSSDNNTKIKTWAFFELKAYLAAQIRISKIFWPPELSEFW